MDWYAKMFNFTILAIKEKNEFINSGTFLQTPFWCNFKARHGWKAFCFKVQVEYPKEDCENLSESNCAAVKKIRCKDFEIEVLCRSFAKGMFSIAYIPLMPKLPYLIESEQDKDLINNKVLQNVTEELENAELQTIEFAHYLNDFAKALKPLLPKNTIFVRFDPDVSFKSPEQRDAFNYGMTLISFADRLKLKKSKVDIQPPDTTLVDLTAEQEEILNRMHSKWRYNIRLSQRKGVVIHRYTGENPEIDSKIQKFYELTKETNARDGNTCHSLEYYKDLIKYSAELLAKKESVPTVSLYLAESEGEEIAGIMTLFSQTESIYLYGASSNKKRNLMPNHLLQWTAMQDAKTYGSQYYDMYGMPPEGKDESHPMHGLYMFKANFGGENIHRIGSWDVPLKFIYRFYKLAENLRAFWVKKVLKKIRRR